MVRQLQALGAPPEVVKAAQAQQIESECLVLEDCWEAVQLFQVLGSQWRVVGGGFTKPRFEGIHFPSIESCLNLAVAGRKKRQKLFADIVLMSDEAARVINERIAAE